MNRRNLSGVFIFHQFEGESITTKQWLQHAYEEALDLSLYLKKLIEEQ